jgi:hypothetical protein
LSASGLKALSIYGTKDGLISNDKYESSKSMLPEDSAVMKIEGGNHCNFGSYGFQRGDNQSTISREEQQGQIVKATVEFLDGFSVQN